MEMNKLLEIENLKRENLIKEFNKNFLVESGAGAGKTYLLVERMTNLIEKGIFKPQEIVAITFTNKAAQELRSRIQSKLLEKLNPNENIKYAIENFNKINISTIHSFANKLIQEMPFYANLGLNFNVKEDEDYDSYLLSIYKKFIERDLKTYIKESQLKIFEKAENKKIILGQISKFILNQNTEFPNYFDDNTKIYFIEELLKDSYEIIDKINKFIEDLKVDTSVYRSDFLKNLQELNLYKNNNSYGNFLKSLFDFWTFLKNEKIMESPFTKVRYKASDEIKNKVKDSIIIQGTIRYELDEKIKLYLNNLYGGFIGASEGFSKFIDEFISGDYKTLSNDDLVRLALKIIEDNESRLYLQNKYKYFFVDEFQDTDPIQTKFILAFCSKDEGNLKNKNFSEFTLKDHTIFLVGDPKQSIYRFRGADLNNYEKVKDIFENQENSKFIVLDKSFRFDDELASEIFDIYKNDFETLTGPYNLKLNNILTNGKSSDLMGIYYPVLDFDLEFLLNLIADQDLKLFLNKIYDEEKNDYFSNLFINFLIKGESFIKDSLKELEDFKAQKSIEDIDLEKLFKNRVFKSNKDSLFASVGFFINYLVENQNIKEKDILVLTRTNSGAEEMSGILYALGYDIDTSTSSKYFTFPSIKNAYNFYKFLIDQNNKNFLRVLRGLFKIDDVKALEIEKYLLENNFLDLLEKEKFLEEKEIEFIFSYLNYNKTSLSAALRAMELNFESFTDGTVREKEYETFISFMEKLLNKDFSFKDYKNYSGNILKTDNIEKLRVMNLHKAKGLQGKFVIIIGESALKEEKSGYFDRKKNQGYVDFSSNNKLIKKYQVPSYDNPEIELLDRAESKKENIRLNYVAATRAESALFVFDLYEVYKEIFEFGKPYLYKISKGKNKGINKKSEFVKNICSYKFKAIEETKKDKKIKNVFYKSDDFSLRPHGSWYGTIFHRLMELSVNDYVRKKEPDFKINLRLAIGEFLFDKDLNNEKDFIKLNLEADNFSENIEKIYSYIEESINKSYENIFPQLVSIFIGAEKIYTEVPFTIFEEKYIRGRIDLLVIKDNIYTVYDYKTDLLGEEANYKYEDQLNFYKSAVEKIFKVERKNIKTKIINCN